MILLYSRFWKLYTYRSIPMATSRLRLSGKSFRRDVEQTYIQLCSLITPWVYSP